VSGVDKRRYLPVQPIAPGEEGEEEMREEEEG